MFLPFLNFIIIIFFFKKGDVKLDMNMKVHQCKVAYKSVIDDADLLSTNNIVSLVNLRRVAALVWIFALLPK